MEAGWFPDPTRRHEFRYHNGWRWTGDVADNGIRSVDPLPTPLAPGATPGSPQGTPGREQQPGTAAGDQRGEWPVSASSAEPGAAGSAGPTSQSNGAAVAALVVGVVGAVLGVTIVLGPLAVCCGLGAMVLGMLGRVRAAEAPDQPGRGAATAGIVLGVGAVVLGAVGYVLATSVLPSWLDRRLGRVEAVPHQIVDRRCSARAGAGVYEGELENRSPTAAGFRVEIRFIGADGDQVGIDSVRIAHVGPGQRHLVESSTPVTATPARCDVVVYDAG